MSRIRAKLAARQDLDFVLTAEWNAGALPVRSKLFRDTEGLGNLFLRPVVVDKLLERHARESNHLSRGWSNGLFC